MRRTRFPPMIEMSVDGRFIDPRRLSWPVRIAGIALTVAVVAGALGVAALALWIATMLIPLAVLAACVAWVAYRFQAWRQGSPPRRQDVTDLRG